MAKNVLNGTNWKQIIVRNLGPDPSPPPEKYIPMINTLIVPILTDPPPSRQGKCHYNCNFFKAALS